MMMMNRTDIINMLIDKVDGTDYLEIGVAHRSANFDKIICDNKVGVDPNPDSDVILTTSDEYFTDCIDSFDVIFIDGLHHSDQVLKDIKNSLEHLKMGGYIVLHDCNPLNEKSQLIPQQTDDWSGDVWKAFVNYRRFPHLEMFTIDCDYGCGVITLGKQTPLFVLEPEYKQLVDHKKEWLNLISPEEFIERIK